MEGTIGEIRMFASNFAPKNWNFCDGSIIAIRSNTALFSILGNVYGGDGRTTFGLPNLKSAVPIGVGSGPGLTPRALGETGGASNVTLSVAQMPMHSHALQATLSIQVNNDATAPGKVAAGSTLGKSAITGKTFKAYSDGTADIALNAKTIGGSVTLNASVVGGNVPHNNMQPYIEMNYVICMYGVFPVRP